MKDKVSALRFGIRMNFPKYCGEEKTDEAIEILKELERLAEIGAAIEWALEKKIFQDDFEFNMLDIDFVISRHRWNISKEDHNV